MIKIGNNLTKFFTYSCRPADKKELKKIIEERISKEGPECDLNDIDVSLIANMSNLFYGTNFNGNISRWDTSNVKLMFMMFAQSCFNGDISDWDVSKVTDMSEMFYNSSFNQDISKWDVSNVGDMQLMFCGSEFNQDISNWKIKDDCKTMQMFRNCNIKEEFKPKSLRV